MSRKVRLRRAVAGEGLHVVGGHYAPVDDGAAQVLFLEVLEAGERAQEAAGEGIPRTGWVVDELQGVGGEGEEAVRSA